MSPLHEGTPKPILKKLKYGKKSETKFQEDVIKYLKSLPRCHIENTWGRFGNKGQTDVKGCLDGRFLAIELKTEKGKLSIEQQAYINKLGKCGAIVGVARNLDEVKGILKLHGY